jgi:hypothetical protein
MQQSASSYVVAAFVLALLAASCRYANSPGNSDNPVLTVALTDLSASTDTEEARQAYQANIDRILKTAQPGDSLHFGWITTTSVGQLEGVHVGLPQTPGGLLASRFDKKAAHKKRKTSRAKARREIRSYLGDTTRASKSTDLMSALHWAGQIFERSDRTKKILVIQSDMIEAASYDFTDLSFEDEEQIENVLRAEKKLRRLPNFDGVRVYVVGLGAARRDSRKIYRERKFWTEYFQRAGAEVETYGGQLPNFR